MMDIYDEAMQHLFKHPEELEDSIRFPGDYKGGYLFLNAGKNPYSFLKINGKWLNNPVFIKGGDPYVAEDDWLTAAIRNDSGLPSSPAECRLQHLPLLAAWQRKIDQYYHRRIEEPKVVEEDLKPEEIEELEGEEPNKEVKDEKQNGDIQGPPDLPE